MRQGLYGGQKENNIMAFVGETQRTRCLYLSPLPPSPPLPLSPSGISRLPVERLPRVRREASMAPSFDHDGLGAPRQLVRRLRQGLLQQHEKKKQVVGMTTSTSIQIRGMGVLRRQHDPSKATLWMGTPTNTAGNPPGLPVPQLLESKHTHSRACWVLVPIAHVHPPST